MYQGHKNWNHWNVALWLLNDESMCRHVKETIRQRGSKEAAAWQLAEELRGEKTPDGAPYSFSSIRAAITGEI